MQRLVRRIEEQGPTAFAGEDLAEANELFHQRSALFYTPTVAIPDKWVGSGPLSVELPLPFPNWYEFYEIYGYRTPRLWVDLLQRSTGKLRWEPLSPASVRLVRYDTAIQPFHVCGGAKPLLDALKESTTGRSDGRLLYYFGAIIDDNPDEILQHEIDQKLVDSPGDARTEIFVEKCESDEGRNPEFTVQSLGDD